MRRRGPIMGGLAVVVAVASVVITGQSPAELPTTAVTVHRVPVTEAVLDCPDLAAAVDTETAVFAVAPRRMGRAAAVDARSSSLTLTAYPSDSGDNHRAGTQSQPGVSTRPGVPINETVAKKSADPSAPSALVVAEGAQAPGATAAQWSSYVGKHRSGLAASWCQQPSNQWWFNGVDTSVGTATTLVVSNPTPGTAVFDLGFYGSRGSIDAPGARGMAIPGNSRRVLDLARLAPGYADLTVTLRTSRGRVVAAIHTSRVNGLTPAGAEWMPAAAAPAREVIVDAGFAGRGKQEVAITNPGNREALVSVEVLDQGGPFTPNALANIQVPPGSVVVKDISSITRARSVGVGVTANVPVTAATRSHTPAGPIDFAVASVSAPLSAPAVVPVIPDAQLTLALTAAPQSSGEVTIESFDASGRSLRSAQLHLTGGSTKPWVLPSAGKPSYLTVSVDSGTAVYGVANFAGHAGITSLPLISGVDTITRPAVTAAVP